MFFDSTMILLVPVLILAIWAQIKVKKTYARYSKVAARCGLTGAEVAQRVLRDADVAISDRSESHPGACGIHAIPGRLSDHYDPRTRTLNLSEEVFYGHDIAALGVAAHEAGHAVQHAKAYAPLALRGIVYPACNVGSTLAWPLFFVGFFLQSPMLLNVGILLFTLAVFFTVLTLPVEFNASRRALRALQTGGYLDAEELSGARAVLSAAAMTYVAAAAMAIMQLIRMLLLANRR